jgi:hypothetical protein
MARTPEGKVKDEVKKVLKEFDVWYFCPMQNGFGVVGIPDFICCFGGLFFAIETKAPKKINNTTPNQDRVIREIREHGGLVIVVDDAETVKHFLKGNTNEQRWTH